MTARRILLVDDEEGLLVTLAANVELEGFQVLTALSGKAALEIVRTERIDLVITDVRMPGMDGVELFKEIRKIQPEVPVMIMTAFALEATVDDAMQNGIFAVVPKPFDVDRFLALASRALRRPTVLVVDDDKTMAGYLAEALQQAGVRAKAVFNVEGALDAVRSGEIDICVTDMVMPDVDGVEVTRRILAFDPSVTVIAISGARVSELISRVVALGAVECMDKPIDPGTLLKTIARARGRDVR